MKNMTQTFKMFMTASLLSLSAAAAQAADMNHCKDGMGTDCKQTDMMKSDSMKKDDMMKSDAMKKDDMMKSDSMKKDDMMKSDAMKKDDMMKSDSMKK